MTDPSVAQGSSQQDLLSKVSRYEALFELAGVINEANDIEAVGEVLARRLKYIVDVLSWRYICFDGDPQIERWAGTHRHGHRRVSGPC